MVFLLLHPYKQSYLKKSGTKKLKPHFYGLYNTVWRVGEVEYERELPKNNAIHNIFHVSCPEKAL